MLSPNENYNQVLFCFLSPSTCRQHFSPFCHLSPWESVDLHTFRLYFSLPHSLSHNKQSGSTRVKLYMQRSLAISRWPNPGAFLHDSDCRSAAWPTRPLCNTLRNPGTATSALSPLSMAILLACSCAQVIDTPQASCLASLPSSLTMCSVSVALATIHMEDGEQNILMSSRHYL